MFRRFVTRRTLVWLSLTAAIVVMIAINDLQRRNRPAADAGRHGAVALRRTESAANAGAADAVAEKTPAAKIAPCGPPPTIQAAPERPALVAKSKSKNPADKTGYGSAASAPATSQSELSDSLSEADKAKKAEARKAEMDVRNVIHPPPQKQKTDVPLVVYCDISPEAMTGQALDKLLRANGIIQRRQLDEKSSPENKAADKTNNEEKEKALPQGGKGTGDEDAKKLAATPGETVLYAAAPGETVLYAEGTAGQIDGVLAGLAAQPKMFLAFSVGKKQAQGTAGQAGQSSSEKKAAKGDASAGSASAGSAPKEAPKDAPKDNEKSDGFAKEARRQQQLQFQRQQVEESIAPRRRIVFIVRVVEGNQSAAKAKVEDREEAGKKKDKAKADNPSEPPTNNPLRP